MIDKKFKLAVFHLAFVYSGGGEKLVLEEVKRLEQKGYKVDLFACAEDPKKCFPDILKNQKVNLFLPWAGKFLKNHDASLVILSCLLAPLYAYKFKKHDIIFAANQPSLWIASVVKKIYKVPFIAYVAQPTRFLHMRNIDKQTGLYFTKREDKSWATKFMKKFKKIINALDIYSFKSADKILVNGKYMKNKIENIYKVRAVNCPAGVDTIKKTVGDQKKLRNPYILMTNRHAWQKRLEYGITAFLSISKNLPNLKLIISGEETEYTKELQIIAKRLGLNEKVDFIGYVSEKKLKYLYKNALCYLYTAPEEDFGMGVVEAMGSGIPVISWNNAGPTKTIINGKTGFLIKPYDIDLFSKKLSEIIKDKKLRIKMSKNCTFHTSKNYSWQKHISTIEKSLIQ